jgi:hypothetical protein
VTRAPTARAGPPPTPPSSHRPPQLRRNRCRPSARLGGQRHRGPRRASRRSRARPGFESVQASPQPQHPAQPRASVSRTIRIAPHRQKFAKASAATLLVLHNLGRPVQLVGHQDPVGEICSHRSGRPHSAWRDRRCVGTKSDIVASQDVALRRQIGGHSRHEWSIDSPSGGPDSTWSSATSNTSSPSASRSWYALRVVTIVVTESRLSPARRPSTSFAGARGSVFARELPWSSVRAVPLGTFNCQPVQSRRPGVRV